MFSLRSKKNFITELSSLPPFIRGSDLHPWLSMYIQNLLRNKKESLNPNDCHCGEKNDTGYNLNILVLTRK